MIQNIHEPTRVCEGNSPSILYYVFTDEENLIDDIQDEVPFGKSDHVCLTWDVVISKSTSPQSDSKLNFWKGDYEKIDRACRL